MHRYATGLSSERAEYLIEKLAAWILIYQLIAPVIIRAHLYCQSDVGTQSSLRVSTRIGRYFLMVTFGAAYGGTVMARTSLSIGRPCMQHQISEFGLHSENRENVEALTQKIETSAREADEKRKKEKEEKEK